MHIQFLLFLYYHFIMIVTFPQCENDGELEYEFPCFNLVETLDGLWDPEDPRYVGAVYTGVRVRAQHQLAWLFPRLQVQLRRASQVRGYRIDTTYSHTQTSGNLTEIYLHISGCSCI